MTARRKVIRLTMKKGRDLRVDTDVLEWYKSQGNGYQTKQKPSHKHQTGDKTEIADIRRAKRRIGL